MIEITMTGNFPTLQPITSQTMESITMLMFRSIQDNFVAGGRPNQWEPLKKTGEPSFLAQSGTLMKSLEGSWDNYSAKVGIDTGKIKYAAIHQFGGTIKHPGSDKFQVFDIGDTVVFTHGTKAHNINIPARPYLLFQEIDKTKILEILSSAIFINAGQK